MLKQVVIQSLEANTNLKALAKKRDPNGDLWQEVMLYYLQMDESKLVNIYNSGYLEAHCNRLICTSSLNYHNFDKFYKKHTVTDTVEDDKHDEPFCELMEVAGKQMSREEMYELINRCIEKENLYDRELIRLLYFGVVVNGEQVKKYKSIRNLAIETGIPYVTVFHSIKNTQKRIHEQIKTVVSSRRCA